MDNISNEKGFVLVTVMVLTLMASTLVLTSLQDTTVQERLSGNFQKKINSRMMAEKGVYDSLKSLKNDIFTLDSEGNSQEEIITALQTTTTLTGTQVGGSGAYAVSITPLNDGSDAVTIASTGMLYEGETQLQARFRITAGSTGGDPFPYQRGITSCKDIEIGNSGLIDSYDSALGAYEPVNNRGEDVDANNDGFINKGADVTVQTLIGGVEFEGGGHIDGDLIIAESLSMSGGLYVTGDVKGKGNMTLTGNNTIEGNVLMMGAYNQSGSGSVGGYIQANGLVNIAQVAVTEDILSGSTITVTGGRVDGSLLALGNITLNQTTISGAVTTHVNYTQNDGTVGGDVQAGGSITVSSGASITGNQTEGVDTATLPGVTALTVDDFIITSTSVNTSSSTCDADGINGQIGSINPDVNNSPLFEPEDLTIADGQNFYLNNFAQSDSGTIPVDRYLTPNQDADFMGDTYSMFMYDNVNLEGNLTIMANQHITMYVEGNFNMTENPSLTIPAESSLTLIIKGKVWIDNGHVNTPTAGVTRSGKPAFSIFSSYNSVDEGTPEEGIRFTNGLDNIYAVIHAPITNVIIDAGVDFYGSIYGYNVDLSGAGTVHYDSALEDATLKPTPLSELLPQLVFDGWEYVTGDEEESTQ